MKIAMVNPNYTKFWMEAHRAGCRDLNRNKPVHWEFEADSKDKATEEIAGDFLNEGSMTLEEARDHNIHWAPCLNELK